MFNIGAHVTCSYSNDLESLSQAEDGNIEDVKEEWMRAIQNGVDKMNVNKDMNGHNLIYVIKYGICRYAYRICIDSYPGYVVKDPITLIEWVQGLKPGTVIKIRGIFIYHFL